MLLVVVYALFLTLAKCSFAWDTSDMQMFDLIEDCEGSFYEYLGVDQTASVSDIKKAYRKLSLTMHPDKNQDDITAEAQFRILSGVYEILKDPKLRERYDEILEHGMPDWKTPVMYYRKLRKMSNYELFALFFTFATLIHYTVLWGYVFERRFTAECKINSAYKRHKATDKEVREKLAILSPCWKDTLPFAICRGTYSLTVFIRKFFYYTMLFAVSKFKEHRELKKEELEILESRKMKSEKQERRRRLLHEQTDKDDLVTHRTNGNILLTDLPNSFYADSNSTTVDNAFKSNEEWSSTDLIKLVRLVAKFPGGTPRRWERIAEAVQRSVPDVVDKVKSLTENELRILQTDICLEEIPVFEVNENAVCGGSDSNCSDDDDKYHSTKPENIDPNQGADENTSSLESDIVVIDGPANGERILKSEESNSDMTTNDEPYLSRKKLKEQKLASSKKLTPNKTAIPNTDNWSQVEQKQLEVAIRSLPKGVSDRWDRIAECVPTKTKSEVMHRVKYLSSVVRQKS